MATDRGGRLAVEPVYCRNEISSLGTAESSFGSIVLVGSNCQSTFGTFFEVLSYHLLQEIAQKRNAGNSWKQQKCTDRQTVAQVRNWSQLAQRQAKFSLLLQLRCDCLAVTARSGNYGIGFARNPLSCKELGLFTTFYNRLLYLDTWPSAGLYIPYSLLSSS